MNGGEKKKILIFQLGNLAWLRDGGPRVRGRPHPPVRHLAPRLATKNGAPRLHGHPRFLPGQPAAAEAASEGFSAVG